MRAVSLLVYSEKFVKAHYVARQKAYSVNGFAEIRKIFIDVKQLQFNFVCSFSCLLFFLVHLLTIGNKRIQWNRNWTYAYNLYNKLFSYSTECPVNFKRKSIDCITFATDFFIFNTNYFEKNERKNLRNRCTAYQSTKLNKKIISTDIWFELNLIEY